MSLILEALRKSEAERRRGQAPDLYGATPLAPSPRREGFGQWPIVAGGLLVLLALALLFWPRAPQLEQPAQTMTADTAHAAASDTADIAAPLGAGPPMADIPSPLALPSPIPATARDAKSMPVDTTAATPVPGLPARPPPAAQAALQQPALQQAALQQPAPPPARPAVQPPPNTDREAAIPPADALPSLATLSAGERAALPPLKLSVHVWNSDPAQRFAIVDGQRIVEGAALGNAVVAEIRRDGIVLDVNGQRVLLPRP